METVCLDELRTDLKMEKPSKESTKRVFINNVDSYTSRNIAKILSGNTAAADTDEEEDHHQSKALMVVGTVSDQAAEETPFLLECYFQPDKEKLLSKLMVCDVIIYNVIQHKEQVEEALWAVTALHREMGQFSRPKMFLLISTVMTWACSKPLDPDDVQLPFTDEIYWIRRAHPNFRRHAELEKRVVKLGKTDTKLFSTYVVASGLQYGMGEQIFHYFFKTAWMGEVEELPVFGDGKNIVPMIHVSDLARVIQNVIEHQPKPQYLLAVDSSTDTMEDVIKAIASELGPGKVIQRSFEEAFLTRDLSVVEIDSLQVNLFMEATHIRTLFSMDWLCEAGLVENIALVVDQYRQVRGLLPLRLCVLGPPAVGKSTLCRRISEHYKLNYISLNDFKPRSLSQEETEADSDTDDSGAEEDAVPSLEDGMDDQLVALKNKLQSTRCRNQGFVMDGFPLTYEEAKVLFCDQEQEETSDITAYNKKILPELVVCLEASDSFLTDRVMNLSEEQFQVLNYEPENFLQRLSRYRTNNTAENPVTDFFTELDINPLCQEVSSKSDTDWLLLVQKVFESIGSPRNYGPTTPEVEEEERGKVEEKMRREAEQRAEEEQWQADEAEARAAHWEDWRKGESERRQQEEELLEAQSVPMRSFLMREVMGTLSAGLVECCTVNPRDPVDYLAEYLLQNNPYDSHT